MIDRFSSGKMIVRKFHYEFDGWLGDVLLESCPCFIVTEAAKKKLQSIGATGIKFASVHHRGTEDAEVDLLSLWSTGTLYRIIWEA